LICSTMYYYSSHHHLTAFYNFLLDQETSSIFGYDGQIKLAMTFQFFNCILKYQLSFTMNTDCFTFWKDIEFQNITKPNLQWRKQWQTLVTEQQQHPPLFWYCEAAQLSDCWLSICPEQLGQTLVIEIKM
jgi:hypothetical protein